MKIDYIRERMEMRSMEPPRGFGLIRKSKRHCLEPKCHAPLVQRPGETDAQFSQRYLCAGCEEYRRGVGVLREQEREKMRRSRHRDVLESGEAL